jgi:dimethylamine monooxygenase subunit A
MSEPVLHTRLPLAAWMEPRTSRLPGVQPVEGEDWLRVDEAFAAQMALRDRLVAEREGEVVALLPEGQAAAEELYGVILARLAETPGYRVGAGLVTRPDGVRVTLDPARPLQVLARLVQEDLCLMLKPEGGAEHVLTGATLCFPASWSLAEKLGRPLIGIHRTVKPYDPDIARRVQRLFDLIRPEQALWRMNAVVYVRPDLFQPGREDAPRTDRRSGQFLRSERQTFKRLPQTGAVLFAIHSYVVALDSLSAEEKAGLEAARL